MSTDNYDLTFQANLGNIVVGDNPNFPVDLSSFPYELFLEHFEPNDFVFQIFPVYKKRRIAKRFAIVDPNGYIILRCPFHELFEFSNDPSFTINISQIEYNA